MGEAQDASLPHNYDSHTRTNTIRYYYIINQYLTPRLIYCPVQFCLLPKFKQLKTIVLELIYL